MSTLVAAAAVPAPPEPSGLSLEGLVVEVTRAGQRASAVTGLSLEVAAGESVGLVGESGCGKSLTLRAVTGLLPTGSSVVGGTVTTGPGGRTGMVFQEPRAHSARPGASGTSSPKG